MYEHNCMRIALLDQGKGPFSLTFCLQGTEYPIGAHRFSTVEGVILIYEFGIFL